MCIRAYKSLDFTNIRNVKKNFVVNKNNNFNNDNDIIIKKVQQ
jgi:hypothetical protein